MSKAKELLNEINTAHKNERTMDSEDFRNLLQKMDSQPRVSIPGSGKDGSADLVFDDVTLILNQDGTWGIK